MCWQWLHSDHSVLLFASLTFQDGPSAEARMKQASRVCLLLARASAKGQVSMPRTTSFSGEVLPAEQSVRGSVP